MFCSTNNATVVPELAHDLLAFFIDLNGSLRAAEKSNALT
jgi:hypothetical protein